MTLRFGPLLPSLSWLPLAFLAALVGSSSAGCGKATEDGAAAFASVQPSPAAAAPTVSRPPAKASGAIRIVTYNLEWWNEEVSDGRIANLKEIFADLQPDVAAFQEVQSRRSLERFLGPEWQIAMLDAPDEFQELAVAVRRPLTLKSHRMLFPDERRNFAFPGRRDVLEAVVATPDGEELRFYSNHFKSRSGGRLNTDPQRVAAAEYLATHLLRNRIQNAVVLGDFNDTPNDQSLQILESGDSKAPGGGADRYRVLYNPTDALHGRDGVSIGLASLFRGEAVAPFVAGAKADNDRLRGIDYRFPQDVRVTQALFDQILVSPELRDRTGEVRVYSLAPALRGTRSRVRVSEDGGRRTVEYTEQGERASDHLPVYLDLAPRPKAR